MQAELALASIKDTVCLGSALALHLKQGDCLLLRGDLGTGKTELARAIIRAWCKDEAMDVTSPTFNLVQTYQRSHLLRTEELWHFDLYRIERGEELRELALEEALANGIVIVEWPERAPESSWPEDALNVSIKQGADESSRIVHFSGKPRHEYVMSIKI